MSLSAEVAKLAKLSHIQNGLPGAMRGLPVLAILAGEVVSKVTMGPNIVEERLLGVGDVFLLNPPREKGSVGLVQREKEGVRDGILMMCQRCRSGPERDHMVTKETARMVSALGMSHARGRAAAASLWLSHAAEN